MKVKLVFSDWQDANSMSVYNTIGCLSLSSGDFHSGSTFDAMIEVEESEELLRRIRQGYRPVFYVREA